MVVGYFAANSSKLGAWRSVHWVRMTPPRTGTCGSSPFRKTRSLSERQPKNTRPRNWKCSRTGFATHPGENFTLGAFEGDKLIGMATFIRETGLKERHKGRIYGVYVTSSQRGKG